MMFQGHFIALHDCARAGVTYIYIYIYILMSAMYKMRLEQLVRSIHFVLVTTALIIAQNTSGIGEAKASFKLPARHSHLFPSILVRFLPVVFRRRESLLHSAGSPHLNREAKNNSPKSWKFLDLTKKKQTKHHHPPLPKKIKKKCTFLIRINEACERSCTAAACRG